ncbi:hypothetical protein THAOC_14928, partial [Thalassiosira oceanica]
MFYKLCCASRNNAKRKGLRVGQTIVLWAEDLVLTALVMATVSAVSAPGWGSRVSRALSPLSRADEALYHRPGWKKREKWDGQSVECAALPIPRRPREEDGRLSSPPPVSGGRISRETSRTSTSTYVTSGSIRTTRGFYTNTESRRNSGLQWRNPFRSSPHPPPLGAEDSEVSGETGASVTGYRATYGR